MSIAKKVAALLPSRDRDEADPEEDADETDPAGLYECEACGVTYISEAMSECPNCDGNVERVPTERELGMLEPAKDSA